MLLFIISGLTGPVWNNRERAGNKGVTKLPRDYNTRITTLVTTLQCQNDISKIFLYHTIGSKLINAKDIFDQFSYDTSLPSSSTNRSPRFYFMIPFHLYCMFQIHLYCMFQIHPFWYETCGNFSVGPLKWTTNSKINNEVALFEILSCQWTGNRPLSGPSAAYFTWNHFWTIKWHNYLNFFNGKQSPIHLTQWVPWFGSSGCQGIDSHMKDIILLKYYH